MRGTTAAAASSAAKKIAMPIARKRTTRARRVFVVRVRKTRKQTVGDESVEQVEEERPEQAADETGTQSEYSADGHSDEGDGAGEASHEPVEVTALDFTLEYLQPLALVPDDPTLLQATFIMLPVAYNEEALIPAPQYYVPDFALAAVFMTRPQLRNYFRQGQAILAQEIARGNGAMFTRERGYGPLNLGNLDGGDGGDDDDGEGRHRGCRLASLVPELKEQIFGLLIEGDAGGRMVFGPEQYRTNLEALLALATTNHAFRAEVTDFIQSRIWVNATVHFQTLFHYRSVPFMPRSHAVFIKQLTMGMSTLAELNWHPYLSAACMPNLKRLVIEWQDPEEIREGRDANHTRRLGEYAALSQVSTRLKRMCYRARPFIVKPCWLWELIEGEPRNFEVDFLVALRILRPRTPESDASGHTQPNPMSQQMPNLPQYVGTQHTLIQLGRDPVSEEVLFKPGFWKICTLTRKQAGDILLGQDYNVSYPARFVRHTSMAFMT